jgi:hypothetical protein
MPRIFTSYCVLLVTLMAVANHQGYVFSSLFAGAAAKADKSANRYHK